MPKTNDMNQFKRAEVVMLPTNEKPEERIGYFKDVLNLNNSKYHKSLELFRSIDGINIPNPHHLYIISDDEPKLDEWGINTKNNVLFKSKGFSSDDYSKKYFKKIIATTDTSLLINIGRYNDQNGKILQQLPQLSQQFIEKYIEEYNKGNIITDVLVEYENIIINQCNCQCHKKGNFILHSMPCCYPNNIENLKINPKDNTINIKELKDSWNGEEVKKLLSKLLFDVENPKTIAQIKECQQFMDKWIQKNL